MALPAFPCLSRVPGKTLDRLRFKYPVAVTQLKHTLQRYCMELSQQPQGLTEAVDWLLKTQQLRCDAQSGLTTSWLQGQLVTDEDAADVLCHWMMREGFQTMGPWPSHVVTTEPSVVRLLRCVHHSLPKSDYIGGTLNSGLYGVAGLHFNLDKLRASSSLMQAADPSGALPTALALLALLWFVLDRHSHEAVSPLQLWSFFRDVVDECKDIMSEPELVSDKYEMLSTMAAQTRALMPEICRSSSSGPPQNVNHELRLFLKHAFKEINQLQRYWPSLEKLPWDEKHYHGYLVWQGCAVSALAPSQALSLIQRHYSRLDVTLFRDGLERRRDFFLLEGVAVWDWDYLLKEHLPLTTRFKLSSLELEVYDAPGVGPHRHNVMISASASVFRAFSVGMALQAGATWTFHVYDTLEEARGHTVKDVHGCRHRMGSGLGLLSYADLMDALAVTLLACEHATETVWLWSQLTVLWGTHADVTQHELQWLDNVVSRWCSVFSTMSNHPALTDIMAIYLMGVIRILLKPTPETLSVKQALKSLEPQTLNSTQLMNTVPRVHLGAVALDKMPPLSTPSSSRGWYRTHDNFLTCLRGALHTLMATESRGQAVLLQDRLRSYAPGQWLCVPTLWSTHQTPVSPLVRHVLKYDALTPEVCKPTTLQPPVAACHPPEVVPPPPHKPPLPQPRPQQQQQPQQRREPPPPRRDGWGSMEDVMEEPYDPNRPALNARSHSTYRPHRRPPSHRHQRQYRHNGY